MIKEVDAQADEIRCLKSDMVRVIAGRERHTKPRRRAPEPVRLKAIGNYRLAARALHRIFYTPTHQHLGNGMLTPITFERQQKLKLRCV
jgi:hypothetical protein